MKENIKLIAMDLDGTVLNNEGRLSERTKRALEGAAEKGISIVIASGRAYTSLPEEVLRLPGLVYAITSNGSAVYDTASGERRFEFLMEAGRVDEILELIEEEPQTAIEVFYQGSPYASEKFLRDPVAYGAPSRAISYLKSSRVPVEDLTAFVREHRAELDSIDIIVDGPLVKLEWLENLEKIGGLYLTSSVYYRLEIADAGSGKGAALKKVAEQMRLRPEEIIAFGNAQNDIDMIEFAGTGVAVANSPDVVRAHADLITASNQEDGVAQVLEKLLA